MDGWFLGGGWLFLIVGFVFYYGLNGCGGFVVMGCWRGGKTGVGMDCQRGYGLPVWFCRLWVGFVCVHCVLCGYWVEVGEKNNKIIFFIIFYYKIKSDR